MKWDMGQAEVVEGISRYLHYSGLVAVELGADSEIGIRLLHADDIRGRQMQSALSNIDVILANAQLTRKTC